MPEGKRNVVDAVFELREAAIAHGQVLEQSEHDDNPATIDALLESQLELEEKTAAAIEECEDDGSEKAPETSGDATPVKVVPIDSARRKNHFAPPESA